MVTLLGVLSALSFGIGDFLAKKSPIPKLKADKTPNRVTICIMN